MVLLLEWLKPLKWFSIIMEGQWIMTLKVYLTTLGWFHHKAASLIYSESRLMWSLVNVISHWYDQISTSHLRKSLVIVIIRLMLRGFYCTMFNSLKKVWHFSMHLLFNQVNFTTDLGVLLLSETKTTIFDIIKKERNKTSLFIPSCI